MTAPFVATVTKPPSGTLGRSRLLRGLLITALLLLLLLAIALLVWMAVPKAGEGEGRASWMERMFGRGGENHLKRIELEKAICSMPKDIGPCRGAMPRYFYSTESGTCEAFLYGGCDGNANNFETAEECTSRCGGRVTGSGERKALLQADCSLPKEIGPCRGAKQRFFYNTESGTCEAFLYGGCDGNANNFQTAEECTSRCGGEKAGAGEHERERDSTPDCSSEPDAGVCMAYMEKYAYRPASGACEKFVYGGCGGNGNRYSSRQECEERCARGGGSGQEQGTLQEGTDHDTKVCGVSECPMDCGLVRRQGDCVLCQCADSPFTEPGQLAVPADQPCPPGHTLLRTEGGASVCGQGPPEPLAAV